MNFVCSVRFNDGAVKRFNFNAVDEVDACWTGKAKADENNAELINVWHARSTGQIRH